MISAQNITFRFGNKLLLDDASFSLQHGQKVALIGSNGAGKTTLFNILTGELAPENGLVDVPLRKHLAVMEQEAPSGSSSILDITLAADTEREQLLKQLSTAASHDIADIHTRLNAISAHTAPQRAARILIGLGFKHEDLERPADDFSGGWKMRLSLARILFLAPDIMLLDEPTNHLDLEASLWLTEWLKNFSGTLLFISHDRDVLNKVPNHILHLSQGKLKLYGGPFDTFIKTRRLQAHQLEKQREKQEKQRAHMEDFVNRFRAKASKAKQAQSRLKMLEKMEVIEELIEPNRPSFDLPEPEILSPPIYSANQMSCGYSKENPILKNLTFRISMGDRIGLIGANGNGKTTFMRMLAGEIPFKEGDFLHNPKLRIGYFSQEQAESLDMNANLLSYMQSIRPQHTELQNRSYLGRFGFSENHMGRKISSFSGGEKARLSLAMIFMNAPHLLLLDEPSNHLDIESREALIHVLSAYEGAIITVSHDTWFLSILSERFWLIQNGRLSRFDGDLDDYEQILSQEKNQQNQKTKLDKNRAENSEKVDKKQLRKQNAEKRSLQAPLRKKIETLEKQLEKQNIKLKDMEAKLSEPSLYEADNNSQLISLNKDIGNLKKDIEENEEKWMQYSDELEILKQN